MHHILTIILLGMPLLAMAQRQPPRPTENTRVTTITKQWTEAQLQELKSALLQEKVDFKVVATRDTLGNIVSLEGSATLENGAKATFRSRKFAMLSLTMYSSYESTIPYRIEGSLEGEDNSMSVDN